MTFKSSVNKPLLTLKTERVLYTHFSLLMLSVINCLWKTYRSWRGVQVCSAGVHLCPPVYSGCQE